MINENHEIDSVTQNTNPESKNAEKKRADSCPPGWTVNARGQLVWDEAAAAARKLQREKAEALANTSEAFEQWIDTATKGLRYPPDRKKAGRELRDHYEDRLEVFLDRGLPRAKAEQQALDALGDPEETGRLLRAVHKPWLGWLLRLTRIAMICVIALLFFRYNDSISFDVLSAVSPKEVLEDSYFYHWDGQTGCSVIARKKAASKDHVAFGPFDVALEDGGIYLVNENTEQNGEKRIFSTVWCRLLLSFSAAPWHKVTTDMVDRNLHIVTDTGERYVLSLSPYEESDYQPTFSISILGRLRWNAWACLVEMDVPDDAKWLELWFSQSGEENRIRVDLSDWTYGPDSGVEYLTDEAKAVDALVNKSVGLSTFDLTGVALQSQRPLEVKGIAAENSLSVPWAAEIRYRNGSVASSAEDPGTETQTFVECILIFSGTKLDPLLWEDLSARIQVTSAEPGSKAQELIYGSGGRELYRDAILWRIRWLREDGAASYVISDTGGKYGTPCSLTIELGEEAAP